VIAQGAVELSGRPEFRPLSCLFSTFLVHLKKQGQTQKQQWLIPIQLVFWIFVLWLVVVAPRIERTSLVQFFIGSAAPCAAVLVCNRAGLL